MRAGTKQTVQHRASSSINVVYGQLEVIGCKSAYDTSDSNRKSLTTLRINPAVCVEYSVLSGRRFTNSTWTRGWGGFECARSVTPVTFYILRHLKWIRPTARNVQVMRWMHGCVAFVTDAYKGTDGDSSISRISLVHGSVWQELSGVWHTYWCHFPVALPRTQHTSGLYVYSWILPCPIAPTVHTREVDFIPGNKKHTWRLPRSVIGTSNFGKLYSPYI